MANVFRAQIYLHGSRYVGKKHEIWWAVRRAEAAAATTLSIYYFLLCAELSGSFPIDEFKLDAEKVNINGGACALGHPVGSTGSRIILTLIHALKRTGGKRGIAALCIGGGEATAVAIELI